MGEPSTDAMATLVDQSTLVGTPCMIICVTSFVLLIVILFFGTIGCDNITRKVCQNNESLATVLYNQHIIASMITPAGTIKGPTGALSTSTSRNRDDAARSKDTFAHLTKGNLLTSTSSTGIPSILDRRTNDMREKQK